MLTCPYGYIIYSTLPPPTLQHKILNESNLYKVSCVAKDTVVRPVASTTFIIVIIYFLLSIHAGQHVDVYTIAFLSVF